MHLKSDDKTCKLSLITYLIFNGFISPVMHETEIFNIRVTGFLTDALCGAEPVPFREAVMKSNERKIKMNSFC